jgi:hypothetical protein
MEPLWYELERRGIRPGDLRHADNASAPDWVPVSVIEEEGLDGIEDLELVSNSAPIDSKLEQLSRLG